MRVLLTNDDGPESPLLIPFVEALAAQPWCDELRVVVPGNEKSWIGKAITRFEPLVASNRRFGSVSGYTVDGRNGGGGTPADCVALGVRNLYPEPPDLVISGINMGPNAGLAFALSSGTLGGAIEASLYRVPAIALSLHMDDAVFTAWHDRSIPDPGRTTDWNRFAEIGVRVCRLLLDEKVLTRARLYSVNLPWAVDLQSPVRLTRIKQTHYVGMFEADEAEPNTYRHRFPGFEQVQEVDEDASPAESDLPADLDVIDQGAISVTALGNLFSGRSAAGLVDAIDRARLDERR